MVSSSDFGSHMCFAHVKCSFASEVTLLGLAPERVVFATGRIGSAPEDVVERRSAHQGQMLGATEVT